MAAPFRRSNSSVLTLASNSLECVTDVDYDESVDVFWSDCDDANGYKTPVDGGVQVSANLTMEYNNDDATKLGYVDPKTSGAWADQPNGATTGDVQITATTATVTGRQIRSSRTGLSVCGVNLVLDGLTVAAIPA